MAGTSAGKDEDEKGPLDVSMESEDVDDQPDCPAMLYWTLLFALFVEVSGAFLAIPIVPLIAKSMDVGHKELGLMVGSCTCMTAFGQAMWGAVSDYLPRKAVITICLVGTSLGYILTAVAEGPALFVAGRSLVGLCGGTGPVLASKLFEVSPLRFRSRDLMNLFTAVNFAIMISPLIGAFLISFLKWQDVMKTCAVVPIINVITVLLFVPSDAKDEAEPAAGDAIGEEEEWGPKASQKQDPMRLFIQWIRQYPSVLAVFAGHFISWIAVGMVTGVLVVICQEVFDYTSADNCMLWGFGGFVGLVIALTKIGEKLLDGPGPRKTTIGRYFCCVAACTFFQFARFHLAPVVFIFLWFLPSTVAVPASAKMLEHCPPPANGINIGVFQFLQMFAEACGMFLGGYWMKYGLWVPFNCCIVLNCVALCFIPINVPGPLKQD